MSSKRSSYGNTSDPTRRRLLWRIGRVLLVASLLINLAALARFWLTWDTMPLFADDESQVVAGPTPTPTPLPATAIPPPTPTETPTPLPTSSPTPTPPRIGLIAGHWKNDSGAICEEDGLREVDVTVAVAHETANRLREQGYVVDVLAEFAPELYGYRADVLLSIHADSCVQFEGTTGFKAARAAASVIPAIEDMLVACIYEEYGEITELPTHDSSVTHNMLSYHAFYKIDPETPAAIIEVGFLYHDRELLTEHPDRVAEGLAESLRCFLETQEESAQ